MRWRASYQSDLSQKGGVCRGRIAQLPARNPLCGKHGPVYKQGSTDQIMPADRARAVMDGAYQDEDERVVKGVGALVSALFWSLT